MSKYVKVSVIFPLVITIVSGIILSVTHDGSDYKSEWFTDDGFGFTVLLTVLLSGFISLLSLTLLLNRLTIIQSNLILSFVTWILLPGTVCLFVINEEMVNFTGGSDIDGIYEGNRLLDGYILSVAILHLLSLSIGYIHFRLMPKIKNEENSS